MKTVFLLTLMALIFCSFPALAKKKLCSRVIMHQGIDLDLSDTEKHLVCGDNKLEAYKVIPPYEAEYFMTSFLQARGYLQPTFETEKDILHVHPGKQAELAKLAVVTKVRKRARLQRNLVLKNKGRVLTPKLITKVEEDGRYALRRKGYPCVVTKGLVDANTNSLDLTLEKTILHPFGHVDQEEVPGVWKEGLIRFSPFKEDELFDERELRLEEKRLMRGEVVQMAYFLEECSEDGKKFALAEKFFPGPPRTFRYGIGASTEQGPMVRVRWSNNRLGSMASNLSFNAQASLRQQSLTATADSYLWREAPRRSVVSQFDITRNTQYDFDQLLIKVSPAKMKWTRDNEDHLFTWIFGPSIESSTYKSKEDENSKSVNTGVIEGSFDWMDHDYEFYDVHPQEGDRFTFNFGYRPRSLGFSDESLRLDSSYVVLTDLTEFKNGKLIGAAHVTAGTLMISDKASISGLPPNVKFYGGGSDDIRGFLLNTLPRNQGGGSKTKLSMKLETRKTAFFYHSIEGFAFVDGGLFGDRSYYVSDVLYYSPGIGLRWSSPIGIVQTYWARGLTAHPAKDYGDFLYVGLGGEF